MDKVNKQMAPKPDDDNFDLDLIDSCTNNVVSGMECTGLVPTPPEDEQESDAYTDLYTIPKPFAPDKKTSGPEKREESSRAANSIHSENYHG